MADLTLSLQTTYQDLVAAHRTRAVAEIGGTPILKQQGGRRFWYDRRRIGDRVVDRYIGPDSVDLRARMEAAKGQAETRALFQRRCSGLVAQLRAGGLPALDRTTGKVLNALAKVGTFRLGGTLVGTHAFRLYAAELGALPAASLGVTEDLDIASFEALSLAIGDKVNPSLQETFRDLALEPVAALDPRQQPTRWQMPGGGISIDFLAPRMQDRRDVVPLVALGVHAQALSYLNFLIAEPILAVALYREGVAVQIPRPERYAVHKLIVAGERRGPEAAKARKDRAQANWLLAILTEDRPGELAEALADAENRGQEWRDALERARRGNEEARNILAALPA